MQQHNQKPNKSHDSEWVLAALIVMVTAGILFSL